MRFLQFLKSLPFWPQTRPDYFTHGLVDGKAAAFASRSGLHADHEQVGERAIFASAALPGRVAQDDAHIYQLGWVEGYHAKVAQVTTPIVQ